ncbi:MAG: hypothetical protein AAFS07_11945 [Pseudomonadota bacterium]
MVQQPGLRFELTAPTDGFQRDLRQASSVLQREAGAMGTALRASTGGFSRYQTVIQQAGFQVGDFATQVASGQSAIVALTQQGTQLLGVFGPYGAVLGAAGAVVGALATYFLTAGEEARTLAERADDVNDAISGVRDAAISGGEGIADIIEKYGALDQTLIGVIQRQTELNLLLARSELRGQLEAVGGAGTDIDARLGTDFRTGSGRNRALRAIQRDLGLSADEAVRLQDAIQSADAASTFGDLARETEALANVVGGLAGPDASSAINQYARDLGEAVLSIREFQRATEEAAESRELLARPIPELTSLAAAAEAERSGGGRRGGGRSADSDVFAGGIESARERIAALEEERTLISLAAGEAARLKIEYEVAAMARDLLTKAAETGTGVTEEERAAVALLSAQYREVALATLAARETQEALEEAQRSAERAAEAQARAIEDLGNRFAGAIRQADSFADALKNIGIELLNIAAQGLGGAGPLAPLLGSVLPTLFAGPGFGDLGGFASGLGGSISTTGTAPALTFANGGVIASGRVTAFARGGIVDGPTVFPMANGVGLMGEAGPEAVIPLSRGPDGKLGVKGGGSNSYQVVVNVEGVATTEIVSEIEERVGRALNQVRAEIPARAAAGAARSPSLRGSYR